MTRVDYDRLVIVINIKALGQRSTERASEQVERLLVRRYERRTCY